MKRPAPKSIRVADLTDLTGVSHLHPMLHCSTCGAEYSANRGDYFAADPSTVFRCCRKPMRLVTKQTVYAEVAA